MALAEGEGSAADVKNAGFHGPHVGKSCPYKEAETGRRNQSGQQASSTSTSRAKRENTQRIRQWAQDNGYNSSSRGRITQSIIDAYTETH